MGRMSPAGVQTFSFSSAWYTAKDPQKCFCNIFTALRTTRSMQRAWAHCCPKSYAITSWRIYLIFGYPVSQAADNWKKWYFASNWSLQISWSEATLRLYIIKPVCLHCAEFLLPVLVAGCSRTSRTNTCPDQTRSVWHRNFHLIAEIPSCVTTWCVTSNGFWLQRQWNRHRSGVLHVFGSLWK